MANGNSNVKLVHGQVRVEAWDLCVDSADRRKSTTSHRRGARVPQDRWRLPHSQRQRGVAGD
jgi:hypothetical protein